MRRFIVVLGAFGVLAFTGAVEHADGSSAETTTTTTTNKKHSKAAANADPTRVEVSK